MSIERAKGGAKALKYCRRVLEPLVNLAGERKVPSPMQPNE